MKTKSRLGKADSIFASTTPGKPAPPREKLPPAETPVEMPVGSSLENRLTVIMQPSMVAFLDRLCLDIRAKTRAKIRRTEVIRALVAGVQTSGMDLTGYGTEADIADAIQKRLQG